MLFHLRLKLAVDPIPELADFERGGSGLVKFSHAHACGHSVLMVGAAHNRRLGNQPKRGALPASRPRGTNGAGIA